MLILRESIKCIIYNNGLCKCIIYSNDLYKYIINNVFNM